MIGDQNARLSPVAQVHPHDSLDLPGSVLSIGSFDSVHRGHQELLGKLSRSADERGLVSVVYTFDPPPKVLFGKAIQLIDGAEKVRRISHFGIDHIILASFDKHYAARPAADFIREIARLAPREIWVGADFRFGAGRSGDVARLAESFRVRVIDDFVCAGGERVSSSRLRAYFTAGKFTEARALHGWSENARWSFPAGDTTT